MDRPSRILVATPDPGTGATLEKLLSESGARTAIAEDGREALRLFYGGHPDAVVLALELPELSGWEALATIRELSDVPVLILADDDRKSDKVRALRAGCSSHSPAMQDRH